MGTGAIIISASQNNQWQNWISNFAATWLFAQFEGTPFMHGWSNLRICKDRSFSRSGTLGRLAFRAASLQ
jgi:hypothetical protein